MKVHHHSLDEEEKGSAGNAGCLKIVMCTLACMLALVCALTPSDCRREEPCTDRQEQFCPGGCKKSTPTKEATYKNLSDARTTNVTRIDIDMRDFDCEYAQWTPWEECRARSFYHTWSDTKKKCGFGVSLRIKNAPGCTEVASRSCYARCKNRNSESIGHRSSDEAFFAICIFMLILLCYLIKYDITHERSRHRRRRLGL